jgi:hypothetical protein
VLVRPDKLDQQAVVEPVVPRLTADKWRINSTSTLRAEYRAPSRRRVLGSSYGRPLAAISDHPASRLRHMTRSHQRSRGRPSRAARSASRITSARHPTMPQPDARPRSRLQRTIERRKRHTSLLPAVPSRSFRPAVRWHRTSHAAERDSVSGTGFEAAISRVRESITATGDSPLSIVTPETLPDLRERVRSTTPSDRTCFRNTETARELMVI